MLLHCPPAEAFLQIKREDRIGAKIVSILGKRVTDGDLLPKGFHCGK